MKCKYFKDIDNISELRLKYFELAKKYHPDKNTDFLESECNEITAEINAEYQLLFAELKNKSENSNSTQQDYANPKPKKKREKKPHKSPSRDLKSVKNTKPSIKRKSIQINRNDAKRGVDLLFDIIDFGKGILKK